MKSIAYSVTAKEVSEIISLKYPDLTEAFNPCGTELCSTPPAPSTKRRWSKRPNSPHPRRYNQKNKKLANESFNELADRALELLYPSMYTSEDRHHCQDDEDTSCVVATQSTPLRAERLSSLLHVRTPPKKGRRGSRGTPESTKRYRHRHSKYITVGLKHRILRLCGSSKPSSDTTKYMSIPG